MAGKAKEIHLYLDYKSVEKSKAHSIIFSTFVEAEKALLSHVDTLHTTIPTFLNFTYGDRLFCHLWNSLEGYEEVHEITIGACDGTNREIRSAHNIAKMLIAGEFDWFR